jgi:hypothetical protein
MRVSVPKVVSRNARLCGVVALALGASPATRAEEQAPTAPPQQHAQPGTDALLPNETVVTSDPSLTAKEQADGTLIDSKGRVWSPERSKTIHEHLPDSFLVGPESEGIEAPPLVTPEQVAAHDRFQIPPVDGASDDKEFASWRTELLAAIKTRDWAKVLPFFSPDVHWSYGEDPGIAGFKGRWKPEEVKSPVWDELTKVFDNGGTFGKSEKGEPYFEAPYWSAWWPASFDPVEWSLLRGTKVALLASPKDGAQTVTTLDWAVVKREQSAAVPPRGWTHVRTGDGKDGYVKDEALETPFGYRAICAKRLGKWVVTAFLTGE